jgi:hypothetical protein
MDLAKRQTWGELNPVTRKPQNSKAYNRNKSRDWKRENEPTSGFYLFRDSMKGSNRILKRWLRHDKINATRRDTHVPKTITAQATAS